MFKRDTRKLPLDTKYVNKVYSLENQNKYALSMSYTDYLERMFILVYLLTFS